MPFRCSKSVPSSQTMRYQCSKSFSFSLPINIRTKKYKHAHITRAYPNIWLCLPRHPTKWFDKDNLRLGLPSNNAKEKGTNGNGQTRPRSVDKYQIGLNLFSTKTQSIKLQKVRTASRIVSSRIKSLWPATRYNCFFRNNWFHNNKMRVNVVLLVRPEKPIGVVSIGYLIFICILTWNPTNQNANKRLYSVVRIEDEYDCPTSRLRGIL